jgi:hypothetical protein
MLASINSRSDIFAVFGAGAARLGLGLGFRLVLGRLEDDAGCDEGLEDAVAEEPMWNR